MHCMGSHLKQWSDRTDLKGNLGKLNLDQEIWARLFKASFEAVSSPLPAPASGKLVERRDHWGLEFGELNRQGLWGNCWGGASVR